MDEFNHVRVERDGDIATVLIDRPEVHNAMDIPTRRELSAVLTGLHDKDDIRVVVFRGVGDGNFISGADIGTLAELNLVEGFEYTVRYAQGLYNHIAEFPLPTIAAVDGYALGGGLELALACDIRVSTPDAKFGLPEVTLGVIPGGGGTQRLQAIVGAGMARELILTGKIIDAAEAKRLFLVNDVFALEEFDKEVRSLARKLAANAPVAVQLAKESMNQGLNLDSGMAVERAAFAAAIGTDDKEEGTAAFLENREPEFEGR